MPPSEALSRQPSVLEAGSEAGGLIARYALAHGAKTLFWVLSDLYFVYYLNEICGVAPIITGLVVGSSILAAALADRVTGAAFASKIRSARDAGRLQLYGACASSGTLLLFSATAFAPSGHRVLLASCALLIFRAAYAAVDVPQNAMLSLVQGPSGKRASLVAYRNVSGGIARLVLSSAFVPILGGPSHEGGPLRFLILALVLAPLVIFAAATLTGATSSMVSERPRSADPTSAGDIRPHLARIAFASLSLTAVVQLEPYLTTREIADHVAAFAVITAVACGTMLSQPLWRLIAHLARGMLWPLSLAAVIGAALGFFALPLTSPLAAGLAGLCFGLANGGLLFTLWDDFAKVAAASAAFGAFARFTAVAKFGQGVAIIGIGVLLQVPRTSSGVAGQIPISKAMGWALLLGAIVLFFLKPRSRGGMDNGIRE